MVFDDRKTGAEGAGPARSVRARPRTDLASHDRLTHLRETAAGIAATLEQVFGDVADFRETLRRTRPPRSAPSPLATTMEAGASVSSASRVEIHGLIAEGGMSRVWDGTQVALGRQVAVKVTRGADSEAIAALVDEARLTGQLEHPNVIPIYDIIDGDDAGPLVVLKKVDGLSWEALLRDPTRLRSLVETPDPLEWHLRVLIQVCHALEYAHSRSIVHLDIKPDNVMIGAFGDVYLVDWGIARSLSDERADDAQSLGAGTPAYIAPEMLDDTVGPIDQRTDVYLLASVLYEIVTGSPPHVGENLIDVVTNALASNPRIGDEWPRPLSNLVRAAMNRNPSQRPSSVQDFRLLLEAFLRHRGAESLAQDAARLVDKLISRLNAVAYGDASSQAEVAGLLGECRFGFTAALKESPDNELALQGLRHALESVAEWQLRGDDPGAALATLGEIADPDPSLRNRIQLALDKKAVDAKLQEAFAQRGMELDPGRYRVSRALFIFGVGAVFAVRPFVVPFDSPASLGAGAGLGIVILSLVLIAGRRAFLRNALNRRAFGLIGCAFAVELALAGYGAARHFDSAAPLALPLTLSFFCIAASGVVAIDARAWPTAAGYGIAVAITMLDPERLTSAMIVGQTALALTALFVWWPRHTKEDAKLAARRPSGRPPRDAA